MTDVSQRPLVIETANPTNYYEVISAPRDMPRTQIDATLYSPANAKGRVPAIIVVPGSLGMAPSHVRHAQTFVELGMAACVIDPFGRRGVTSTVSNQAQYSFAASAYDVLATVRTLAALPEIDSKRIGAQGHSRGGSAVLTAAMRRFSVPVLGENLRCMRVRRISVVRASVRRSGSRRHRRALGDRRPRRLVSSAVRRRGTRRRCGCAAATQRSASSRGAGHSFDRGTAIETIADAAVSPDSPLTYIANDGAMVHPVTGHGRSEDGRLRHVRVGAESRLRSARREDRQPGRRRGSSSGRI